MNFFREHKKTLQVLAFLLVFLVIIANFASLTKADTAYTAFDLLGQFDGTPSYTPRYTTALQNNDSANANALGFSNPYDVVADVTHNRLFVCDTDNYRVLVFDTDSNGMPLDVVADNVIGQPDFTSNSYTSISPATFFGCTSLAYDATDDLLFVADSANQRVLVFDTTSITNGEGAVNVIGEPDFISSGLYTDQAGLYTPTSLAYDETNHMLYVGQTIVQNLVSRISVFDTTSITDGEDAVHVIGQPDYTPLTYIPPDGSSFIGVSGLAVDTVNQLLFVSDDIGNRVLVFDINPLSITDGEPATHVLGQSDFISTATGSNAASFNNPHGLAYNPNIERLFVSDEGNSRISIFNTATIIDGENAVNVIGQATFASGANVTRSGLSSPRGISVDITNKIVFVTDSGSYRLTYYDLNNLADGMDATGVLGQITVSYTFGATPNFTQSTANSGTGTYVSGTGFSSPSTTELDTVHHRLFVSDTANNRVLVYNLDSTNQLVDHSPDAVLGAVSFLASGVSAISASTFLAGPGGLAYDSVHDRLFVSDSLANRILVFDTATISNGEDAVAVIGQSDFTSGTVYSVTGGIRMPQGLAYYADGVNEKLFVSDYGNNKVAVYDVATISDGEAAINYLGDPTTNTYPTCDPASNINICGTYDVKIDPTRMFAFVVDGFNHRVLVYDIATITDGEPAVYVLGQANFTATVSATTANGFNRPMGLIYDSENKLLFVSEFTNNRVLLFDTETISNNMGAVAVLGQSDFTSGTSGVSSSALSFPNFGSFDQENNIFYLPDGYNNRVLLYHFIFLNTSTITPSATTGASYSQTFTTTNSQGTTSLDLVSGTLPPGLTLGASSLSGTPTTAGTYTFTLRAIDTLGVSTFYSNQRSFTITVTGGGGGGGGPSWCQDTTAINYGGSPPCVYANPDLCLNIPGVQTTLPSGMTADMNRNCFSSNLYCFDSQADNYGELLPCTYSDTPPVEICNDSSAINFNQPLPCTYTTTVPLCTNTSATNFGGPLPCLFTPPPPPPPATCQDTAATNVGGALPCVYTPPPPPQLCTDATAENFGGPVPCTYSVTPPVETCATNPALCPTTTTEPPPIITTTGGGGCIVDAPPGADLSTIIVTQISGTFCQARNNVTETIGRIGDVYRSPFGDVISKTISATGLVVGTAVTLSTLLFANPLSFSEIVLIPQRLWSLLLIAFGLKKRIRPWGTVYDSVTKQPLDPAYVVLYDKDGNEVATSITDLDGRYGFIVGPGVYRMKAQKTNYTFPSLVLSRHTRDEIYLDLYFGNYFEVKDESTLIARNIPLDPEKFDWNEFVKREQKLMKFYSKRDRVLTRIADIFFGIGFTSSIIALLVSPVLYNIGIFALYVVLLVIKETGFRPKKLGSVTDKVSGNPLSYGVVRIFSKSLNTQLMTRVLDKKGHYYALVPNGTYYVSIDRKNSDQTYTTVATSEAFEVNEGVINRHFLA